jgi:hypothetical protein
MPFGTKDDAALGKVRCYDAVYDDLLRPAVEAAGMHYIRANEECDEIIQRSPFERLRRCEFVVVDLVTENANVYYELAIRHATRPWSTAYTYRDGLRLFFDLGPSPAAPYQPGRFGDRSTTHLDADRTTLTEHRRHARRRTTESSS